MKGKMGVFLAGLLMGAALCGAGALALSGAVGTVEFNTVGLMQGEEQVFYAGEDFTLDNGYLAPTSVLFTDPSGNGTTYLPVGRIAALFAAEITWDGEAGCVVLAPTE